MRVKLAYGKEGLWVELPDENVTVLEPMFVVGLPDEAAEIEAALKAPRGTPPLRDLVEPQDTVAVVFSDLTRPMPNHRVLPVLLAQLDGIPDHGQYKNILHMAESPQELLEIIHSSDFLRHDQWEAQVQAQIQLKADVYLKTSYLSDQEIWDALLIPCHSIEETLAHLMEKHGPEANICVLPEGPQTIPYVINR
jgi:nickel-dependent lactate racemase